MLRTSRRCASAKAGTSARDTYRHPLLLDYRERLPAAPVGQPVHSLAPGNIFWRGHACAGTCGIFPADSQRAHAVAEISCLDCRALAGAAEKGWRLEATKCLAGGRLASWISRQRLKPHFSVAVIVAAEASSEEVLCFVILSEAKNLSLFPCPYFDRREILRFAQNDNDLSVATV